MSKTPEKEIELNLLTPAEQIELTPNSVPEPVTWNEFTYKEESNAPKITFKGLTMIILCPLLIAAHLQIAERAHIPTIQFSFVSCLFAFLINYTAIIRKYELRPFLPEPIYETKLKWMCILGTIGIVISIFWGWNGSGGILFAMGWESVRGNRMGIYGYLLIVIVVGSLLMEDNFAWIKLINFIPGILFGSINSTLFTLRESSVYAIAHQFLLLTSVILPMLFPTSHIIVPSVFQWIFMLVSGITILFTTVLTIKLMQTERVSVVMGVMSGLLMISLSNFDDILDFIGTVVILVGIVLIIKKQFIDVDY